jgi:hypothetical protein
VLIQVEGAQFGPFTVQGAACNDAREDDDQEHRRDNDRAENDHEDRRDGQRDRYDYRREWYRDDD